MATPKKFYTYLWRDPRPSKGMQPFYVGKGHGKRAWRDPVKWDRGRLRNIVVGSAEPA